MLCDFVTGYDDWAVSLGGGCVHPWSQIKYP